MRVGGKGSEVDIELIKQVSKQIRYINNSMENIRKEIEKRGRENIEQTQLNREELQKIIQEIIRKLDQLNRYLRIDIDDQLEIPVVKIFEKDTNRLIRQIPPEHLLELMKRIDQMLGVLLNERV